MHIASVMIGGKLSLLDTVRVITARHALERNQTCAGCKLSGTLKLLIAYIVNWQSMSLLIVH